jgi:hypothetical protein
VITLASLLPMALAALFGAGNVSAQSPTAPPEVHHIHGLAVDQRDPDVLYVATHTGLVRVRMGGALEWVGTHRFDLMGFTAHPREAGLVYASGHPDLTTYRREGIGNLGLLVSRDGGRTWQTVAFRGEVDFHALAYSPRNGGTLYGWSVARQPALYRISAASWSGERLTAAGLANVLSLAASPDPDGPLFAATRAGLMVSRDGGDTWSPAAGLSGGAPVTAIAYHPSDARRLYAYVARPDRGLMQSHDGGATWESTGFSKDARTPVVAIAIGPGDSVALATTDSTVLRSRDAGRTWQPMLEQGRPATGAR